MDFYNHRAFKVVLPALKFRIKTASLDPGFGVMGDGTMAINSGGNSWKLRIDSLESNLVEKFWVLKNPAEIKSKSGGIYVDNLVLQSGKTNIFLDGLVYGKSLGFDIGVEEFDIMPWTKRLVPGDTIGAVVSGKAKVSGPASSPTLVSDIHLRDLVIKNVELERADSELTYSSGVMKGDITGGSEFVGEIKLNGIIPMDLSISPAKASLIAKESVDINVFADNISTELIDIVIPWTEDAGGKISLLGNLTGSFEKPLIKGELNLSNVHFNVPEWGLMLKDINGTANIKDNLVTVPALSVISGDGKASLSGSVLLDAYKVSEMDIALVSKEFRAVNTLDIKATVNTDLKIQGSLDYPRIGGNVTFTELTYRPPPILDYQGTAWESEDETILVKGEESADLNQSAFLDRGELNIDIKILDTARLRSSELNVRFKGDLALRKSPGGFFLVFGKVEANDGWVIFQGKAFRIEHGVFEFPAIPVIDPTLDILASYRAPEYLTFIKVGGMLSQPTLEIYSEPPLNETDVLAVILFGRPVNELAAGEKEALTSAGGQLVAGIAAANISKELGMDELILQTGGDAETSGVGFGKYVNDKLYVFYYKSFGSKSAEEFRLRYELHKNVSIEANQNDDGVGGVDIIYTKPY